MPLRFLHCSDIHLLSLTGVGPTRFLNKRATGGVNLLLRRRKKHDEAIFDAIVRAAAELDVERLVITGDLTNLSLEAEFEHVRERLRASGLPTTVIPGNHDAYTKGSARSKRFEEYLSEFMDGDRVDGAEYPFVQRFGDDVALVGTSTAVATLPLWATGVMGSDQLGRLDHVLAQLEEERRTRVVLIHHPPVDGVSKERHDLRDRAAFAEVIARRGAELILHGHEHVNVDTQLAGPSGPVPVHGISSGTSASTHPGRQASFCVYDIEGGEIRRERHSWGGERFAAGAA